VQPLQTEAAPRSVCAHCGETLAPPNGTATYVYGVGAVGYQSCAACGAKWRYLWQDDAAPRAVKTARRRSPLPAVLGGMVLVALVAAAVIALASSQRWTSGASPTPTASTTPSSRPTATVSRATAGGTYRKIADGMDASRTSFMTWLRTTASSSPQYQVDDRVNAYVKGAQGELDQFDRLDRSGWPDGAGDAVDALVAADRAFVSDADLAGSLLSSPSFIDRLNQEAAAVHDADAAVRSRLGLAAAP